MRNFLLFLAALSAPAIALGQAYRWVDDAGQVHYSQTPPPDREATAVRPAPPPASAPNQESINKSLQSSQQGEADARKKADQAESEQAKRDAQCMEVNNQLATMVSQTAQRMRVTEEQYQARKQELEQFLAQNCH